MKIGNGWNLMHNQCSRIDRLRVIHEIISPYIKNKCVHVDVFFINFVVLHYKQ